MLIVLIRCVGLKSLRFSCVTVFTHLPCVTEFSTVGRDSLPSSKGRAAAEPVARSSGGVVLRVFGGEGLSLDGGNGGSGFELRDCFEFHEDCVSGGVCVVLFPRESSIMFFSSVV